MKVQNSTYRQCGPDFKGMQNVANKVAKIFANMGEIGEGASITCDFLGKELVVPAVIMMASNEPKDKKEFSALKNPVAATIQLGLEVPVLFFGSKFLGKLANKGFFDKDPEKFSYNEKLFRDKFIKTIEETSKQNDSIKDIAPDLIKDINKNGYTKKMADGFEDFLKSVDEGAKQDIKYAFNRFKQAYKNQFHLKNRICFLTALALTPVLCAIENWAHPKIMNKIYEHRNKNKKPLIFPDIDTFIVSKKENREVKK